MTGSVTYGRSVTHTQSHFTANESTSSDLAASGRDRLMGTGTRRERGNRGGKGRERGRVLDIFKTRSLGRAAVTLFRHSTGHKLLFLGLSRASLIVDSFQVYVVF